MLLAAALVVRGGGAEARPAFNGNRAFQDLVRQVRFGPRVPDTPAHGHCRDFILDTLRPLAGSVETQDFEYPLPDRTLAMSNVIARWSGTGGDRQSGVLLCAHWDTRPTADQERKPARRKKPIPGANDGASGVAVLLELARSFRQTPPPVPVMMVFFDGEDYGPGLDRMLLGARHFAANLPADVPPRGVLLDMIGDRNLVIPQESYSLQNARSVITRIYAEARKLGLQRHFPRRRVSGIFDDHLPLQARGLQVIDLIDFSYGPGNRWWHTLADTPDKCSPGSLRAVGTVVGAWVYHQR